MKKRKATQKRNGKKAKPNPRRALKLVKKWNRTREVPEDIERIPGEEERYYRMNISMAGYSLLGDLSDFDFEGHELFPRGIEVWGKGDVKIMFVPRGDGVYELGGYLTEKNEEKETEEVQ